MISGDDVSVCSTHSLKQLWIQVMGEQEPVYYAMITSARRHAGDLCLKDRS